MLEWLCPTQAERTTVASMEIKIANCALKGDPAPHFGNHWSSKILGNNQKQILSHTLCSRN